MLIDETTNSHQTPEMYVSLPSLSSSSLQTHPILLVTPQHFNFGLSLTLPRQTLYNLLHATLSTLSDSQPLFLIFHDPRADLRSLRNLGFEEEMFRPLEEFLNKGEGKGGEGVYVTDTQSLFAGWKSDVKQVRLEKCCEELEVRFVPLFPCTFRSLAARVPSDSTDAETNEIHPQVPTKRLHNAGNDAHYTLELFERLMDPSRSPAPTPASINLESPSS